MSYISIHLYRKVLESALSEVMSRHDFTDLPVPFDAINEIKAVPSDSYFALHELLDDTLDPGFSVRIGQQMILEDC